MPYVIERPRGPRLAAALELLFRDLDRAERQAQIERALAQQLAGRPLAGLAVARDGDRVAAAVWASPQAGRTATLWAPQIAESRDEAAVDAMLRYALADAYLADVVAVQALVEPQDAELAGRLERLGFVLGAELYYMASLRGDFPVSPPPELSFVPYRTEERRRFAQLVEATYAASLDCPSVDGRRQVEDVLAGYQASGEFDPNRWTIARHNEQDVGVLLLCDWSAADYFELVYMGVIPECRGRGWGEAIVRQAQWQTRQAGRDRLLLAVDAANAPALDAYGRAGFACWDRRRAYLKWRDA